MSTKIYNGYKIKGLTLIEQKDFIDFIKEELLIIYKERISLLYSMLSISTIDDLCELDNEYKKTKDDKKIKEYITKLYYERFHSVGYYTKNIGTIPKETSFDEIISSLSLDYIGTIDETTKNYIENKGNITSITNINSYDYDFDNNIVFLPLNNDESLILVYNEILENLFDLLSFSRKKKYKEFREKYKLKFYGYQNSSDKPTNITKGEWKRREKDWYTVLPSYSIPAHKGINVELFSTSTLMSKLNMFSFLRDNEKKLKKLLVKKEDRVKKYAIRKAKNEYIKDNLKDNSTASEVINLSKIWNELYKEKDIYILERIKEYEKQIEDYIIDLSLDNYKKPISFYLPNFINDRKDNKL